MQRLSRAAFAMFLTMGLSGMAFAGNPPATGLGESWPNATDVSASPNWHVYVFVLNGVKYVQVNDLNGHVLGAIGTAGGQFITLPIGQPTQSISTPQQAAVNRANTKAAAAPTMVYQDSSTVITVTPQNNGSPVIKASVNNVCQDPAYCGSGSP